MIIFAVDNSAEDLKKIAELASQLAPDSEVRHYQSSLEALAAARHTEVDIALLETELCELNGLDLGQYLTEQNVVVHYICEIGDYLTQLMLCRRHEVGFFCPESFLIEADFIESQKGPEEERVRALKVQGMTSKIRVEMVYSSHHYLPGYALAFKDMLIDQYRTRVEDIRQQYEKYK